MAKTKTHGLKGVPKTEAHKRAISEGQLARWNTPEMRLVRRMHFLFRAHELEQRADALRLTRRAK